MIPAFRNNTYLRDIAAPQGVREGIFIDFNTRFADQIDYDGIWSAPQARYLLSKTADDKFLREK